MTVLRDKLKKVSLLSFIEGDLYMQPKTFENGTYHIGLYLKQPDKRKDKHIFWISVEEADILSELGVLLIDQD
jgi:hypothetical protein